jgi:hypothetical protein
LFPRQEAWDASNESYAKYAHQEARMLKRLMITTAAAALVVGSAAAQQTPPPSKSPPTQKSEPMPKASGSHQFITTQTENQWLASKFKGTDVMGANNEKIGDVSDVLFDQNGRVLAYVIGVGGFLGIGQKDVALAPDAFRVSNDRNEMKLMLAMSKDELKNAPEFKARSTRDTTPTTGQAPPRDRTPATPPR